MDAMTAWGGWLVPAVVVAAAALAGWVMEKVVLAWLERWSAATEGKVDDVIVASVRGLTRIWVLIFGLFVAGNLAPVEQHHRELLARALQALWVFTATLAAARLATGLFALWAERMPQFGSATLLRHIIATAVWVTGGLVLLSSQGVSIAPMLTALGVGGLAVALALQDTLANVFAGIHIVIARQVRPGDFVRLEGGQEGTIADIGWRNTSIRTGGNDLVVVPNSKLSTAVVTNCSLPIATHTLVVPCSVAYGSDLARVEQVAAEVAAAVVARVEGGVAEQAPVVRFAEFADSGIAFNVIMWVKDYPSRFLVRHEFIKALHARFAAEGLEIPYPTRTLITRPAP